MVGTFQMSRNFPLNHDDMGDLVYLPLDLKGAIWTKCIWDLTQKFDGKPPEI